MPSQRHPGEPGAGPVPAEAAAALAGGTVVVDHEPVPIQQQANLVGAAEAAVSNSGDRRGAQAALPGVLSDVPVAVLVIDQADGTVTYANTAAIELAGNVSLPSRSTRGERRPGSPT